MTTYYVRQTGSDAAAGTSAGAAWRTIGKALATVASGDTTYIGAGIYRETLILTTSFTSDTLFIGDVWGDHTGDAGEVRLSSVPGPVVPLVSATTLIKVVGKNYYHWQNIVFVAAQNITIVDATTTTAGGTNWTFDDCALMHVDTQGSTSALNYTAIVDVPAHWQFNRCILVTGSSCAIISLPSTATAVDYDVDIQFNNCLLVSWFSRGVSVTGTGAQAHFGGGVRVQSCTVLANVTGVITNGVALLSTSIPCTVYNSFIQSATGLSAATVGQVIEDYNLLRCGTARTSVTAGVHSTGQQIEALLSYGQERIWGGIPRQPFSPAQDSALLGFGANVASPARFTTDLLNLPKPRGTIRVVASGTATSGAATTLTDTAANFGQFQGAVIKITGGTGSGQTKMIKTITGTVVTVYGNWNTNPDNTSTYVIYYGAPSETGKATSGAATTLTMSSASWVTNMWTGYTIEITGGTGSGQTNTVASNTATVLTVPTWGTNPDNTSTFVIYRQTSVNAVNDAVGAMERRNTWTRETVTTNDNTTPISTYGAATHEFLVPVHSGHLTTISVYMRYDGTYSGTLPQVQIDAQPTIGVTAETKTMTSGANTWQQLTLTAFTPTANGLVRVRVLASSTVALGKAFADTFAVSQT